MGTAERLNQSVTNLYFATVAAALTLASMNDLQSKLLLFKENKYEVLTDLSK